MASETLVERLIRNLGYERIDNTQNHDADYISRLDLEYIQTDREDGNFRCNFCGLLESDLQVLIEHIAGHEDHVDWELNVFYSKPCLTPPASIAENEDGTDQELRESPPGNPLHATDTTLFGAHD